MTMALFSTNNLDPLDWTPPRRMAESLPYERQLTCQLAATIAASMQVSERYAGQHPYNIAQTALALAREIVRQSREEEP